MDAGGAECAVGVVLSAGGDHRPLHSGAVSGAGESDTGGGQPHGEKIFRRMAAEGQQRKQILLVPEQASFETELAVLVLCGFDLYFAVLNDRFLWKLLAVFALQLAAVELTFVFPLMARYQNTWRSHMKNAMLVGVGNLPRMLLIWLIWAVPVGACLVFPWLRLYLSLVWLLIGYSSLSYVTALLLRPVFRRLEQPKDDPKKDGTDAS